jgi:hypothetical protein
VRDKFARSSFTVATRAETHDSAAATSSGQPAITALGFRQENRSCVVFAVTRTITTAFDLNKVGMKVRIHITLVK